MNFEYDWNVINQLIVKQVMNEAAGASTISVLDFQDKMPLKKFYKKEMT